METKYIIKQALKKLDINPSWFFKQKSYLAGFTQVLLREVIKQTDKKNKQLEFDKDFQLERAKEMGLFQLRLNLPKGFRVTGFDFNNRIIIRKELKQEGGNSSQEI